ncbi:uncharacterized protein TNCV_2969371 [Trichonephila clavipes]|nr:uncharacterized protein TNCV_2969371 [Trichonephila clavipes]
MRVKSYCAYPNTRDHWALRYMSRCPDQVVSLKRDPQCLSPQANLVLFYRPNATDHLIGTFAHSPLRPMVVYNGMGKELWFQQDGATCHTARATIDLLKDTFGDRLISRFGPVNWPPRSCDLTPLDYFLWGYVKSLVYADKPQTLDHLEDNIRRVIADIRPQMLEKVIENWTSRLTTSEPSVAVLCQKSYLKCNATRLSFE